MGREPKQLIISLEAGSSLDYSYLRENRGKIMPLLDAAFRELSGHKELQVNKLAELIFQNSPLGHSSATALKAELVKRLNRAVDSKETRFKRGKKKGYYIAIKLKAPKLRFIRPEQTNTTFLGKAGEYAVASELLYNGFNVSVMIVDRGIDLIAEKENKFFNMQVKATGIGAPKGPFKFTVTETALLSNHNTQTFYIFLMPRKDIGWDHLVLPSAELSKHRQSGLISGVRNLSLKIVNDPARGYLLNDKEAVNYYINNYEQIK